MILTPSLTPCSVTYLSMVECAPRLDSGSETVSREFTPRNFFFLRVKSILPVFKLCRHCYRLPVANLFLYIFSLSLMPKWSIRGF